MTEPGKGIIAAGAALLWRRQSVLWWLFAANFVTGILAAIPVRSQLRALDSSLAASDSLYHQMNLSRLMEAMGRPEGLPDAFYAGSIFLAGAYFLFLVFATGGVLESFYSDRSHPLGEFLRTSAEFFWRMVRLLVVFAILMTPLSLVQGGIAPLKDWIGSRSDSEQLGFWVALSVYVALMLIGTALRLWVDVAQIDAVAHDQPAMRRSLGYAGRLLRSHFGRVYGALLAVHLLLWVITVLLLWLWIRLPHEAIGLSFAVGQLIVLLWLAFRLWQKAIETVWYQQHVLMERRQTSVEWPAAEPASAAPGDRLPATYDLPT